MNGFSHVIIQRNCKSFKENAVANNALPQLILVSGRTEQNVNETISKVINEYEFHIKQFFTYFTIDLQ